MWHSHKIMLKKYPHNFANWKTDYCFSFKSFTKLLCGRDTHAIWPWLVTILRRKLPMATLQLKWLHLSPYFPLFFFFCQLLETNPTRNFGSE